MTGQTFDLNVYRKNAVQGTYLSIIEFSEPRRTLMKDVQRKLSPAQGYFTM